MSDYRYQVVEHNGVGCLHVMIDGAEHFDGFVQTYIPLDDIMFSALSQGYVLSEELLHKLAREHVRTKET